MKNINLRRKIFFLSILLIINAESLFSNVKSDNYNYSTFFQQPVKGTVTDPEGLPLPGVSIVVKGTLNGVQTDFDGNFSIKAQSEDILVFSYIGMETLSVEVSNSSDSINISMQESASELDEVVIVGYGSQKVVNLTGSVETIKGNEIARQPVVQTSQALAGLSPGLVATQSSGQPGNDGATIRIRGIGTLGAGSKNDPLILVDGIPDNLNGVDPNDIESISVLKDASAAAIYGSRAANGVIIITTKRGKVGETSLTYDTYVGINKIAQNLDFLDGLGFMEYFNQGIPGSYTAQQIADYAANSGTDQYPDTDWVDRVFSEDGVQQYHRIGLNGGSERVKVAASIAYTDQDGNVKGYNFKRYNGRFNTDIKLNDKFNINFDLNFRRSERQNPSQGLNSITRDAYRIPPLYSAVNSDGTWGPGWNGFNPVAFVSEDAGFDNNQFNYFRGLVKLNYEPVQDLILSLSYAPQHNGSNRKRFVGQYDFISYADGSSGTTPGQNSLLQSYSKSHQDNFNFLINYSKEFIGEHKLSGLLGYENLKNTSSNFQASRRNFVLEEFPELSNGDQDTQENLGVSTLNGLESVFGRVNYTYKDRYLVEANLRRDASSRFAKGYRADWFPSFSVGWNITEEPFFRENSAITFLKLRGSWGKLGNQGTPNNFNYVALFELGENPVIGNAPITGGAQTVLSNPFIRWESTTTSNIAIDSKFLDNRLSLTAEYYERTTDDILLQGNSGVPPSVGLIAPVQNIGSVENKGWDIAIDWQDQAGDDFTYGVNFNISDVENKVTDLGGLNELPPGKTIIRVGEAINSIYGLKKMGLFQNQAEIDGAPVQNFGAYAPGDIRYVDLSGDDLVNNEDRAVIGNSLPKLNYGLDFFASYKGFDFSMSWLGVGKRDIILEGDVAYPFFNAGKIQHWQTDAWTPSNTDANYPRLLPATSSPNWRTSEQWMFDASYLRLRNVTVAYNFSSNLLEGLKLDALKVYLTGQNLFTIDNLPEGIDPNVPNFSSGAFYPITSIYTLGLSVKL